MGKSLGGFLLMYIIGGYLRLFVKQKPLEKRKPNFRYLGIFVGLCVLDFVVCISVEVIGQKTDGLHIG